MDDRPCTIGEAELEVLKVLWDHGPGTVRDVDAHLRRQKRRWAYTTVLTLLQRLETTSGDAASRQRRLNQHSSVADATWQ